MVKAQGRQRLLKHFSVGAGGPYTVAAIGTKATKLALQVFTDNNLVASGKAKLSVYNLSPDAGPLSVATGGEKLISGLAYQQASDYMVIPAGSYTLDVAPSQENTIMQLPATLPANTVTSVFSVGLLNGTPKFQLVTAQVPGTPNWPGTGSDPNPVPTDFQTPNLWLIWSLVLTVVGASGVTVGWFVVRHPVSRLRHYRQ